MTGTTFILKELMVQWKNSIAMQSAKTNNSKEKNAKITSSVSTAQIPVEHARARKKYQTVWAGMLNTKREQQEKRKS